MPYIRNINEQRLKVNDIFLEQIRTNWWLLIKGITINANKIITGVISIFDYNELVIKK